MTTTEQAIAELASISRKAQLIHWLQAFTTRDLSVDAPRDTEKLSANLGVSKTNLDKFVRPWVNARYRVPDRKPRLARGALDDATFGELIGLASA